MITYELIFDPKTRRIHGHGTEFNKARLKFEGAPFLKKLEDLTPLTEDPAARKAFLGEVEGLLA